VVDTNVLFTFFWEDSLTKKLLVKQELELFSPEFALEEINGHSDEILQKTGISPAQFKELRRELAILVEFIPMEEYSEFLEEASVIPDKDDIDFLALALKLGCPIWSNDPHLDQGLTEVFTTRDVIKLLFSK
jgi:predicted nucleic acid-binding protein